MINLKDLKIEEEYFLIDTGRIGDPEIIKFKVINKLKGLVEVQFLKYIDSDDNKEEDVVYHNQEENEIITEELYKNDQGRIFRIEDLDLIKLCLIEAEKQNIIERQIWDIENYTSPEEYPDWDGDESIMYYIDNYCEEDETDVVFNLEYFELDDLLKLLHYFNLKEDDTNIELVEFLKYLELSKEDIRRRSIANYIFTNILDKDIIFNAITNLQIKMPDYDDFDDEDDI